MTNEYLDLKIKRNKYHINIDKELVHECVGNTIALILQIYQPNSTKSVAGNDVDREHYNRDSVVPTNRSPSSIKGTISRSLSCPNTLCAAHTMKFGCFGTQQLSMLHRIMTKSGLGCVIVTP